MSTTTTKAANAHTTVVTGWTNPTNAYSTTNDSTYATCSPGKNATVSGDFGFPAFTTGDIPDHATIDSVTVRTTWKFSLSVVGEVLGMQLRRNTGGVALGTETTASPLVDTDANQVGTGATLTDLRTANELRARLRATKGNTSTGLTASLDRVYLDVVWSETITAAAGAIALSATLSAAGTKKISNALGALTPVLAFSEAGSKAVSGAGSLSTAAVLAEVGKKATTGAAGALGLSAALSHAGNKNGSGAGSITASAALSEAGFRGALGVAALTLTAVLAEGGSKAGGGDGVLSSPASLTEAGSKTVSSDGIIAGVVLPDGSGSKGGAGTATLTLTALLSATGSSIVVSSDFGCLLALRQHYSRSPASLGTQDLSALRAADEVLCCEAIRSRHQRKPANTTPAELSALRGYLAALRA